jgi:hypothetical protein
MLALPVNITMYTGNKYNFKGKIDLILRIQSVLM